MKVIEPLINCWRVPELRKKLLFTALILLLYRIGCYLPLPGIDVSVVKGELERLSDGGGATDKLLGLADMFTGGAFKNGAIFALGIMPYISASIIFQLLVAIVPAFEKLKKEGSAGQRKIAQWTRYATLGLCIIQSGMICTALRSGGLVVEGMSMWWFYTSTIMIVTAGTMLLMWLGEQIDDFGIGSGISLIIMVSIISRMPSVMLNMMNNINAGMDGTTGGISLFTLAVLVALFVFVVFAVVVITQGARRIPMQRAKQMVGRKMLQANRSYLPMRVNQAGVIPIIFAQSMLMLPMFLDALPWSWAKMVSSLFMAGNFCYIVAYMAMIMFFSYFYAAITFNPVEQAENLKQYGMFVPGIRPGVKTAEHFEKIMNRVCFAGAIFLAAIAIVPQLVSAAFDVDFAISSFFGGTGLLIVVGVGLDVVQRIESQLMMTHHEKFLKSGRIRGRRG